MPTSISSGSERIGGTSPEDINRSIHDKHAHHHNHHGAHHFASEKERLKKLVHRLEMMLESQDDDSDSNQEDKDDKSIDHHKKMLNLQFKDGIKQFKQQFNLNDYVVDGAVDNGDGNPNSGDGFGVSAYGQGDQFISIQDGSKKGHHGRKGNHGTGVHSGRSSSGSSHVENTVDVAHTLAADGDIVLSGGIAVLYLFMNLLSDLAQYKYLEMREKAKVSRDAQNMANEVNELIAKVSQQGDSGSATLPADVIRYMEENNIKIDDKSIDDYLGLKGGVSTKVGITGVTLNGNKFSDSAHVGVYIIGHTYTVFYNGKRVPLNPDQYKIVNGKITATIDGKDIGVKSGKMVITGNVRTDVGRKLNKGELTAVKSALENTSNRASDFVSQSQLQLQKIMQTYNVTVSLINSMQTLLEEMNKSIAQNIR